MTPATVHLLAQLIRHSRAMLTVFETWLVETNQPKQDTDSVKTTTQARR